MGRRIHFIVGPHDGLFTNIGRYRRFSDSFGRKLSVVEELGLCHKDVKVTWPRTMKGLCITVEIVFLFDDLDWVQGNLPRLLESVFLIFKRARKINKDYNVLKIRHGGINGSRKLEEREFNLRRKYKDQALSTVGVLKADPDDRFDD